MRKIGLSFILVAFFMSVNAQSLLKIQGELISLDEFKSIFYKNNDDIEITKDYLDEYIDLFINFKLKVREAEELGLDTTASFILELEGYRKQLAKPYLKNKDFDQKMLAEAYARMQKDVHASHILISFDSSSDNEEKAYKKALEIRESIVGGNITFSDAAKKNSDDKSAMDNGGDLGFFTVFMMVYDFETAAYETPVGEISMPVKTKYGYHLVKTNEIRDAFGKVKVSHIMFKEGQGSNKNKLNNANEKINKVIELLKSGEKFKDLAEKFSEDRSTAVKGGELPMFGVGKMVPEFEKMAFSLQNIGEISVPFSTNYGWHIIKLLEKHPIPNFVDVKADLKRMIEQDTRGELSNKALYKKLHNTYKVINKPTEYSAFRKESAFRVAEGNFVFSSLNNRTLLTIDGVNISVNQFADYILENQSKGSDIDQMYMGFVDKKLLEYEDSKLEEKYPDYKNLLKEYKEGILLFNLTNTKVWSKAVEDTLGLQDFYTKNSDNYMWKDRVHATVYSCIDLSTAKRVKRAIYKKHRDKITDAEILKEINANAPLSLQVNTKRFSKGENKYVDSVKWQKGISKDIVLEDGSYVIVDIHEFISEGVKQLDEARGKVISDYQNYLELEWLSYLKSKYSVEINLEVLYSLIK